MDDPKVVTELIFTIHGRTRDECIAYADRLGNEILSLVGGEPWIMADDDWKRVAPPERLTLVDHQGFMYMGMRRYIFHGPLVGQLNVADHDGYRTQHGQGDSQQEHT